MSNTKVIHHVTFWSPNILVSDSWDEVVDARDPNSVVIPERAYAFQFYDTVVTDTEVGGKTVQCESKPDNFSPTYYPGGQVYTLEEIQTQFPDKDVLYDNVKRNGYKAAVKTCFGQWFPFEEDEVAIIPDRLRKKRS